MHFSKIFPTKYFAICFFEILDACCNLKQGSLVMSLPFFFWGVSDMGVLDQKHSGRSIILLSIFPISEPFNLIYPQHINSSFFILTHSRFFFPPVSSLLTFYSVIVLPYFHLLTLQINSFFLKFTLPYSF